MEATCNVHRPHIIVGKDAEEEQESYLLRTRVLRASPSMSSAMMINGFLCVLASSRAGMIDWTVEIFFSQNRISASWNSLLAPGGRKQYHRFIIVYTRKICNVTHERFAMLLTNYLQCYPRKIRKVTQERFAKLRKKDSQCYARKIHNVTQERIITLRKKES